MQSDNSDLTHCSKQHRYSITLVGARRRNVGTVSYRPAPAHHARALSSRAFEPI